MEEGLWGEKDGGKFGNELLDFGYGVGWFLARVWSGGGLEGQMEKGGGGSIVDHLSDLFRHNALLLNGWQGSSAVEPRGLRAPSRPRT